MNIIKSFFKSEYLYVKTALCLFSSIPAYLTYPLEPYRMVLIGLLPILFALIWFLNNNPGGSDNYAGVIRGAVLSFFVMLPFVGILVTIAVSVIVDGLYELINRDDDAGCFVYIIRRLPMLVFLSIFLPPYGMKAKNKAATMYPDPHEKEA